MPKEQQTETMSITVTRGERQMVDEMAADEVRSMANMVRLLIREGYARRQKAKEASDG